MNIPFHDRVKRLIFVVLRNGDMVSKQGIRELLVGTTEKAIGRTTMDKALRELTDIQVLDKYAIQTNDGGTIEAYKLHREPRPDDLATQMVKAHLAKENMEGLEPIEKVKVKVMERFIKGAVFNEKEMKTLVSITYEKFCGTPDSPFPQGQEVYKALVNELIDEGRIWEYRETGKPYFVVSPSGKTLESTLIDALEGKENVPLSRVHKTLDCPFGVRVFSAMVNNCKQLGKKRANSGIVIYRNDSQN